MTLVIHDEQLRMVHIQRVTDGKPVVDLATSTQISPPLDPEGLTKIAKETLLANYALSLVLPSADYQILSVDAPNVPPEEMKDAIRFRLKDLIDFKPEDATIDVLDIPLEGNAAGRSKSIFVIAARNTAIQPRQQLFTEAGLSLSVIDIPEMAQRNLSALVAPEGRGLAMLSFDSKGGLLTVTYKGELYLSRRIELTLAQLQSATGEQRTAHFDRITLELQRSLDHFDRQYNFVAMAKLVLGPMGSVGGEFKTYLAANLYVPVELLDLQEVLDLSKVPQLLDSEVQAEFFMCLGAALRLDGASA